MNVICLTVVTDTVVTHVTPERKRFEVWRTPQDGELLGGNYRRVFEASVG